MNNRVIAPVLVCRCSCALSLSLSLSDMYTSTIHPHLLISSWILPLQIVLEPRQRKLGKQKLVLDALINRFVPQPPKDLILVFFYFVLKSLVILSSVFIKVEGLATPRVFNYQEGHMILSSRRSIHASCMYVVKRKRGNTLHNDG